MGLWSGNSALGRHISYDAPTEIGMFVVAQATHHLSNDPYTHSLDTAAAMTGFTVDEGVGMVGRASNITSGNNNSIQLRQSPHDYSRKPIISDHGYGGGEGRSVFTSGSSMTCQECGNQAKKDCNHRRCRSCCKSRGFDCATHVKSTWVPAAHRRERHLITSTDVPAAGSLVSAAGTKKQRTTPSSSYTSTSNTTLVRSYAASPNHHQDASFTESLPGQVRAPAVFKCVRVTTAKDKDKYKDGDDEYAYQACVVISGHVFKGFLYDQGDEPRDQTHIPNLSELNLGGGGGGGGGGGRGVGGSLTSRQLDTRKVYGSSGGRLLG